MTKREELLRSEVWYTTGIQNDLFRAVNSYLTDNNISRQEFAEKLGVSKGRMSQILNGDFNGRLDRLVELALAAGKAPVLEFKDLENYVKEDAQKESRAREARRKGQSVLISQFSASLETAHAVMYKAEDFTHTYKISANQLVEQTKLTGEHGC